MLCETAAYDSVFRIRSSIGTLARRLRRTATHFNHLLTTDVTMSKRKVCLLSA